MNSYNLQLSNRSLGIYIGLALVLITSLALLISTELAKPAPVDAAASCASTCVSECTLDSEEECQFSCEQTCRNAIKAAEFKKLIDPRHPNAAKPTPESAPNFSEAVAASRFMNYYLPEISCEQLISREQAAQILGDATLAETITLTEFEVAEIESVSFIYQDENFVQYVNVGKGCKFQSPNLTLELVLYPNSDIDDSNTYQSPEVSLLAQNYIAELQTQISSQKLAVGNSILGIDNVCAGVWRDQFGALKHVTMYLSGIEDSLKCGSDQLEYFLKTKVYLDQALSNLLTNENSWSEFNKQ